MLQFELESGSWMRIEPWGSQSFRIRLSNTGRFTEPALMRYGMIRRRSDHAEFRTSRIGGELRISTDLADLWVDEQTGHFRLASVCANGRDVADADAASPAGPDQAARHHASLSNNPPGLPQDGNDIGGRTRRSMANWNSGSIERLRTTAALQCGEEGGFSISFALEPEEYLYGLGDAAVGRLNKRGASVDMQCRRGSPFVPIPYVMSSRGWAVATATTFAHSYDLGQEQTDRLTIASEEGEPDLFVIAARRLPELLNSYTDIVGKPTLLPKWAYGLSFIGNAHIDARQVTDDALKFRQSGIPCELIVLNSGWTMTTDDGSASHEWHRERFPLPSNSPHGPMTFIDILHRHGFKLSVMINCNADLTIEEKDRANAKESNLPIERRSSAGWAVVSEEANSTLQPTSTKSTLAWYDHLRPLVTSGISAFYMSGSNQLELHPGRVAANGMDDQEMHNLYPVLLVKQMHDGFREQTGGRPFIVHAMAGYTGIQQFAATPTGRYGNKEDALGAVLGYGLSGHVHTTINMDLSTRDGIHAGFLQTWVQVNNWSHVWHPCLLEQSLLELFRTYASLRNRLIPYLYTTAHQAARTGMPVVRAMPLMFPDDPVCRDMTLQYMLGDFLLVGVYTNRVYLPDGVWIDFWTGERYVGPDWLEYELPGRAGGPLFIRAGAIIPFGQKTDYIGQHNLETLELHLYPHEQSEWTLIEDDETSYAYETGSIASTTF